MGKRKLRSSVGAKSKNSIENAQAKKKEATAVEAAISEMKTYKKKTKIDDKDGSSTEASLTPVSNMSASVDMNIGNGESYHSIPLFSNDNYNIDLDPTASSSSHPEILTVGIDEYEQQLKFPGEKPDWAPNFIKLVQHTIPTPDETIVNIPDNLLIKQIPSVVSKAKASAKQAKLADDTFQSTPPVLKTYTKKSKTHLNSNGHATPLSLLPDTPSSDYADTTETLSLTKQCEPLDADNVSHMFIGPGPDPAITDEMVSSPPSIVIKSEFVGQQSPACTIIPASLVIGSLHHLQDESQNGGFESSSFFTDDAKVEFYTGIQGVERLWFLFRYLEDRMEEEAQSPEDTNELPQFEQFCITLMHLRLNLQPQDLAYRFNLIEAKVSAYIDRFMSAVSKFLIPTHIQWQKRIDIQLSLPKCFNTISVRRCICIVEIFQVHLDHNYSLKYLIAFSPLGLVSYVSPAPFPGHFDELQVWKESAILDQFAQGDQLLKLSKGRVTMLQADFFKSAPNFTGIYNKRVQLNEIKLTGDLQSGLQAHVERVIDNFIRRFAILSKGPVMTSKAPGPRTAMERFTSSYKVIGKLIQVCCALHNSNPIATGS